MYEDDPAKRIPKSLGTDAKLYGPYTLADVAVALGPAVIVVLVTQLVLPPSLVVRGFPVRSLTFPVAAAAGCLGALVVFLTPPHLSSLDWLGLIWRFHRGERSIEHDVAKATTRFARAQPEAGALERTDGSLLGMVRVDPPSTALATDADWRATARAFQDFCNTVVEFPVQFYSTTQAFPVEDYLAHYRDRRVDPDVTANPKLAALLEAYIDWFGTDLGRRRITIREHYVIVPVTPAEVRFDRGSVLAGLARIPVVRLLLAARSPPKGVVQREAMVTALDDRLGRIERGLREVEGCHASRVDAAEATRVLAEFWSGEQLEYGSVAAVLRTRPIVGGPP